MSAKSYEKIRKLLDLLIFFLFTLIAIFLIGLITRDWTPAKVETRTMITEDQVLIPYLNTTNRLLEEIRDILIEIRGKQPEPEPEPVLEGPDLYDSYAEQIVQTYYPQLDARYVKAIIYHESRYDPTVINSKTGVMGLMQISPKWHTNRANDLGVFNLLDPYGNILVGCDLLAELTNSHDFNYALNFFAGGYPYANRYRSSTSPYVKALENIIANGGD